MKIIAIRGKNLASLAGEFEIDFSQPPLRDAGIFAICGNTGSGKSTLLDAMCIALYATSPRLNKVSGNSDITDTNTHTIKERDCRNILRKGAANGYSEVEFKALDGHIYRARWSVRRARDNRNGKMQESEHTLFCITDSRQINGGKSEILSKISSLIGLTYEQFTRAVLLAQGEFATFLKATSKEKAEILEKLTGTDVYSKISARIYECYKQASADVKVLEEKIKDMPILSPEEEQRLLIQKQETEKEQQIAEILCRSIEKKISWIERKKLLQKNIDETNKNLLIANEALSKAKTESEFIRRIDSTMEIRDTYLAAVQAKKQIEINKKTIDESKTHAAKLKKEFEEAKENAKKKNNENEEINTKWLAIQPKIKKAEECETELRNIAARTKEIKEEITQKEKELATNITTQKELSIEVEKLKKEELDIKKWFEKHKRYASIVSQSNIVIANINNIAEQRKQIIHKSDCLNKESKLLENDEKRLLDEEKELARLNTILPTEIANLRKALVEGLPCPVCGSRHHEVADIEMDTLKEDELQATKKNIEEKIEHLKHSINNTSNSINITKALIEKLNEDIMECEKRNIAILLPLKEENEIFDTAFAIKLQEISKNWEKHSNRNIEIENISSINSTRKESLEQREKELLNELDETEKRYKDYEKKAIEKRKEITILIGESTSAKEIELQFAAKIKSASENFTAAIEKRGEIMAAYEKAEGSILQLEKATKQLTEQQEQAKEAINAFLSKRTDALTLEELHKLMIADEKEIATTRKKLEDLRNNIVTNEATLKERRKALEEHLLSADKSSEEETEEQLKTALRENSLRRETLTSSLGTINGNIKQNESNKILFEGYRKEHEEKNAIYNRWSILNDAFGSATGDKFKIIAQGYTLDILLDYANKHLQNISQRYSLARISSESLAIKVIDNDMFKEERSVYSLSGGESFLVSLAMALALSSLSSNRMNIESLFIDEGFGSLDNDTLRTAMEALEKLQNLGRKVGVISHLQDMIERIPVKIRITKEQEGKSKLSIEVS